jgi:hypothetical protein
VNIMARPVVVALVFLSWAIPASGRADAAPVGSSCCADSVARKALDRCDAASLSRGVTACVECAESDAACAAQQEAEGATLRCSRTEAGGAVSVWCKGPSATQASAAPVSVASLLLLASLAVGRRLGRRRR